MNANLEPNHDVFEILLKCKVQTLHWLEMDETIFIVKTSYKNNNFEFGKYFILIYFAIFLAKIVFHDT